jgi:hypothetical protein
MLYSRIKWVFFTLAVVGIVAWQLERRGARTTTSLAPAPELGAFVYVKPTVPIVFTSRLDTSSFQAAAPEGEGFVYPGTIPWAAREGRLRLLDVTGQVYELTWDKPLPDGETLVDVMSPSISLDGTRVLFAGRRAAPDAGRWRIYELELRTGAIKQKTGGPGDKGCSLLPPMRFAKDGSVLPPEARCRTDFDDIDPIDLGDNSFAFASSRIPDLGRDHAVRATQIWIWPAGEKDPHALTANRNNDRWPIFTTGRITFSSWSRNREVVTADRSDIQPVVPGQSYATNPTDNWLASEATPNGGHFGYAIKSQEPVWRPRPLFNGRMSFMTSVPSEPGRFRLAQADWGYIRAVPSSLSAGMSLPNLEGAKLYFGPQSDSENRQLSAGCPSPYPGNRILFAGKTMIPAKTSYGLYSIGDDWSRETSVTELLFDDPQFEDAEPVAVYARGIKGNLRELEVPEAAKIKPPSFKLVDGQDYSGPAGFFENLLIRTPNRNPIPWAVDSTPERLHDPKLNVIPPPQNIEHFAIYAAYRDRFDDPVKQRVLGEWKKLVVVDAAGSQGSFFGWSPADPTMTTVLAGLDEQGKIAQWSSQSEISAGRTFLAYAGDHYSQVRSNGYHHCIGCHAGHSYNPADIQERMK